MVNVRILLILYIIMCSILPLAMSKPDFQAMRTQLMVSINPILSRVLFWWVKTKVPVETIYIQGLVYIFTVLVVIIILRNQVSIPIYHINLCEKGLRGTGGAWIIRN